jgi:phosphoribosylformimino-5-aminoimidazole carboxamide ribotide isomerase
MRVVGVLDLMGGVVVRGVGGRREHYLPVVSGLCPSAEPLAVATALRDRFGINELYLADLDAIAGAAPAMAVYARLKSADFPLWVDAGLRQEHQGRELADAGIDAVVAGLETLAGPDVLAALVKGLGSRVVFSLDLRGGIPLRKALPRGVWAATDPWGIATEAIARGVNRLLVLDLARVGMGQGTGTEQLCARLAATSPGVELAAGGGVRGPDDLRRLQQAGVTVVLLASALYDGRLTRDDLAML